MTERRAVPRHRTFLKAVLAFHNGNSSEDALVRNLADGGALVELSHPNAPDAFELIIPAQHLRRQARVAWRNGGRLGARFEAAAPAEPAPPRAPVDDRRY